MKDLLVKIRSQYWSFGVILSAFAVSTVFVLDRRGIMAALVLV